MGTWKHMVLPVVCMALSPISLVARITRTSMLDVINQDYIRTARAKGVQERTVIFSHALRNALIPVVTVIGAQLTMVVGGSFIIESVFSIPGIGMLLLSAINTRDFPTIQGTVLVLSFFVCIINLMTDVAYAYVDPRIKSQYSGGKKTRNKRKEGQNG
jgi:peptide/nickel transport system permease protein